jgi:hypothetical protein
VQTSQTLQTFSDWKARACSPEKFRHADAAFSIDEIAMSADRASSGNSKLRMAAPGARHNDDGAFVIERVGALLLDREGALVRTQRYHDGDSPLAIGKHTTWSHEVYDAELAAAHSVRYVIETRIQVIRTLLTCDLGTPDVVAESAVWPIVAKHAEPNDLVAIDVALATRRGQRINISVMAESRVVNRGFAIATEFYFLNRDGVPMTSGTTQTSLVNGFAHDRTDAGLDRTIASTIDSLVVRARIEMTLLSELDPIVLPAACRITR